MAAKVGWPLPSIWHYWPSVFHPLLSLHVGSYLDRVIPAACEQEVAGSQRGEEGVGGVREH